MKLLIFFYFSCLKLFISMKYFFLILFTIIQSSNYEIIELNDYKKKINKGYQIIDVRTQSEFVHGHIPNATNIDFYNSSFITEINKLSKNKPVLIYCRSGNRSQKAGVIMDSLGFDKIYDLKGGYSIWNP